MYEREIMITFVLSGFLSADRHIDGHQCTSGDMRGSTVVKGQDARNHDRQLDQRTISPMMSAFVLYSFVIDLPGRQSSRKYVIGITMMCAIAMS